MLKQKEQISLSERQFLIDIKNGNEMAVEHYLQSGGNIDFEFRMKEGVIANSLVLAAREGQINIVRQLISNGINPSCDVMAYVMAIKNDYQKIAEEILRSDSIVEIRPEDFKVLVDDEKEKAILQLADLKENLDLLKDTEQNSFIKSKQKLSRELAEVLGYACFKLKYQLVHDLIVDGFDASFFVQEATKGNNTSFLKFLFKAYQERYEHCPGDSQAWVILTENKSKIKNLLSREVKERE